MNLRSLITGALLALTTALTFAAGFEPTSKPIEIVVPYPAGGATDKMGRTISEILNNHGWKSVVVNKPGADTVIGANFVASSARDGHTLYLGGNGFANLATKNKVPGIEHSESSFTSIVPLGEGTLVLSVPANSPVNNYEQYKEWVKKNPSQFNVGTWNKSMDNVYYEWAKLEKLPKPTLVSYKGSAPMVLDLVGGNIQATVDTFTVIRPHYEAGKVKILAVLEPVGTKIIERVAPSAKPAVISKKYPILNIPVWYGLFAPTGTDPKIINELNAVINKGLKDPKVQETFYTFGIVNVGGTPQELDKVVDSFLKNLRTVNSSYE